MAIDERQLVDLAQGGDTDAFGGLVALYKDAIFKSCYYLVRDESAAEDIAQEAFIKAYLRLNTFDTKRKFSTWLFKIATNTALDYLKKQRRYTSLTDGMEASIPSDHIAPSVSAEQVELHDAVRRLEPKYQAVISLYYWQGHSYSEIAEIMGKREGSIKGWMHRAKHELRKELA